MLANRCLGKADAGCGVQSQGCDEDGGETEGRIMAVPPECARPRAQQAQILPKP